MVQTERAGFELVLGARQLSAVLFVFATLTASVAAFAYVAGRMVGPVQAAEPVGTQAVVPVNPKPPEPPRQLVGAAQAVRRIAPQTGELYVQAGVVQRGMAEVMAECLNRKGFAAGVAEGTSEANLRVLVGPVSSVSGASAIRERLEEAGFASFSRRL